MNFVDLRHVTVMRGETPVLLDVDLQIAAGESVAILGPNGCGKSTLLKTLTCELYPVAKPETVVSLFGRARWDVTELRRRMGVVASDAPVRDAMDRPGLEIVLSGFFSAARLWPNLHVEGWMRDRAAAAMAAAGVEHLAERPMRAMSSGQQKRLYLARALAAGGNDPETTDVVAGRVLLLDEPTNTLDLVAQRDLRVTMQRLAEQGTAVILITHHVEDIVPAMTRTLLMRQGRIVADGETSRVLNSERLSALFGQRIELTKTDLGFFAR